MFSSKESLWRQEILHKYIEPLSMEDRIMQAVKPILSNIWKVIVQPFPLVGNWMAWNVGNGVKVRIGADPWVGSGEERILSEELVVTLQNKGIHYLAQTADPISTTICKQGCKSEVDLRLSEREGERCKEYVAQFQKNNIRLREDDSLV